MHVHNIVFESRWVKKSGDLKKKTSAPGWMCSKVLERMLGGLPCLPMTYLNFWEEIRKGNWATMMMSHKEEDNKHSEANSCRTMGTLRSYFCLVSTINGTWWN
jgi:hypothetical protein